MIEGKEVVLRPILEQDIVYLNKWKNDEETFKYLGGGFMPTSIDQQKKWMESMMDTTGNNKRFIITDNNGPIGMIGLYGIHWINRNCEIGMYIGEKESKGNGYGKEACKLIEQFAKKYLNLKKIKLNVVSDNKVAINMWTSLGYEQVGIYKEERFVNETYKDLVLMEKFIN